MSTSRDKITYEWRGHTRSADVMRVRLGHKIVGVIRLVKGGYAYFPTGSKEGGEVFRSVRDVQESLESAKCPEPNNDSTQATHSATGDVSA